MASATPAANRTAELSRAYAIRSELLDPTLPSAVRRIATLLDGQRSLGDISRTTQISEAKCLAVIRKLTLLGLCAEQPTATVEHTDADFSPLEQSFFSSTVPAIDECNEPFRPLSQRMWAHVTSFLTRLR